MSATNYVRVVESHQRRCATVYAIVYQTGCDMCLIMYRLYSHLVFLRFPYVPHRRVVSALWLPGEVWEMDNPKFEYSHGKYGISWLS